jgi:hypothetical protein
MGAPGGRKLSKFMASKPQRAAAAASDEEAEAGASESEEEEAPAALTAVERRAARLDGKRAAEAREARAEELDAAVQEYEPFDLPSAEELAAEARAPDLPSVRRRIQDVARVLANFKRLRQPGRTRAEYMERLMADLQHYYGCGAQAGAPRAPARAPRRLRLTPRAAAAQLQRVLPGVHPERIQRG